MIKSLQNLKLIENPNEKIFSLVLQSIELLFENCPNIMNNYLESIAKVIFLFIQELMNLIEINLVNIRYRIGRVWMSMIKFNNEVFIVLFNNLFKFFLENLKYDHYELNFNTCDFFNFILQDNGALLKNEQIHSTLEKNLSM